MANSPLDLKPTGVVALVVLYRRKPSESETLLGLLDMPADAFADRIVIWDNSPASHQAEAEALLAGCPAPFDYFHTPENRSLSSIYNQTADTYCTQGDFLLILDQDSRLPCDYIAIFRSVRLGAPAVRLFAPQVYANGRRVSPARFRFGWGRPGLTMIDGLLPARGHVGINSGLFLEPSLFHGPRSVRFDEQLRFYGTDTDFFMRFGDVDKVFSVLPVRLEHDLSFDVAPLRQRAEKFREILTATRFAYRNRSWLERSCVCCVIFLVQIRYAIRHRSLSFIILTASNDA